ncbi:hypothetical protein G6F37_005990 [Rhizopus arrhizus]|nr:hypothetical protein G6F38_005393 [Rhizopus arrhizus]KAG1158221.1 hypothetical protein G6F37_005990 [Rhizopus arrhizus]
MNAPSDDSKDTLANEALFSIMFVSVGFSCFIWQSFTTGWMAYKSRKPIVILVFFQAILGVFATFITLLIAFVNLDCTFRLYFSVICVNVADISLQFILLWKAYLGNNRSKTILFVGSLPILAIAVFILINLTVGKSNTKYRLGVCLTEYPTYIVIVKAAIDFTSNIFLSSCFVLVIYRHYRILGNSIQKMLLKDGLIYCFGVCFSNIITGILLTLQVLGGNTPIIYTVDWYLASYLIIRQLRHNKRERTLDERKVNEEEEEEDEEEIMSTPECTKSTDQEGNHCYHVNALL